MYLMPEIAVIFDMDGVLLDTERLMMECFLQAARELGLPCLPEAYLSTLGVSERDTLQIYAEQFGGIKTAAALLTREIELTRAHIVRCGAPVKAGAEELLSFLQRRGCRLALASSNQREYIDAELKSAGLLHYFEAIVSADTVAHAKPHPEIYMRVFALLHAPAAEGFAVEDAPAGIAAAHAAGLKPILVPDLLPPDEAVKRLAHKVVSTLDEARVYFASIL